MLSKIKKWYSRTAKDTKITAAAKVTENGITLHGEDPGTIPPDDNPNPLTNEHGS